MEKHSTLDLLFETLLRHLYKAENQTLDNLKLLADTAASSDLKSIFLDHREETRKQMNRLERIFDILRIDIHSTKLQGLPGLMEKGKELLKTLVDLNFTDKSKGMDGIISEGKEMLRHFGNSEVKSFALVICGQKVEQFEIACYRSLLLIASEYEIPEINDLLQASLKEEEAVEKKLADFASEHLQTVKAGAS